MFNIFIVIFIFPINIIIIISISNTNIIVDKTVENNYTGDFTKFYSYETPKIGLHLGWLRY